MTFSIRDQPAEGRGAAGLCFRVYRHNSVAVYREVMTRRDCDGLSDTRAMGFELSLQTRNAPDATNDDPVKENAP